MIFLKVSKATPADDAEAMLTDLRKAGVDALNRATPIHSELFQNIDTAVFETRKFALEKLYSKTKSNCWQKVVDDLDTCINDASDQAFEAIASRSLEQVNFVLDDTLQGEKLIAHCATEDCLTDGLGQLNFLSTKITDYVYQQSEFEKTDVAKFIDQIKACANAIEEVKC